MKRVINFIKNKTTLLIAIIVASILGGATTAVVLAAIPDSNGQVNACYKNSTMVLRVTDPTGNCASNETPISWDQSSGSHTYTNMVSTPQNTVPVNIVTIPQMGQFSITQCAYDPNAGQTHFLSYTNNTSQVIDFSGFGEIAPGQSQDLQGGFDTGTHIFTDTRYVLSTNHQIVSISLESRMKIISNTEGSCDERIQAISSVN